MIWDNASWHISKAVRTWIRAHNRAVRQQGKGVRIIAFYLPSKSPWLNRMEPHWVHGKRNIVEPARLLTAQEVADRVCAYFGCAASHNAYPIAHGVSEQPIQLLRACGTRTRRREITGSAGGRTRRCGPYSTR